MIDTEKNTKDLLEIFKITTENSFLKYYRTPTIITSPNLPPIISVIKEIPFLLVPNIHSYTIYNLQDLKIQFISEYFEEIFSIVQSNVFVYVASSNHIFKTLRGEIISKIKIGKVLEMIKFGIYLVANIGKEIIVFECEDSSIESNKSDFLIQDKYEIITCSDEFKELYRLSFEAEIKFIFHPNTYVNKILIVFENGNAEIFNLKSRKSIFKYNFGDVSCISQTDILDVIALGMKDGSINIYNLKKNKLLLKIDEFTGNPIKYLSLKANFAAIVTNRLSLYNLDLKKEIHSREGCYHSLMINETLALFTTKNSIEILNLDDFTILKFRKILNENIKSLTCYSKTEILCNSDNQLFKMNIYRDEMNRFLKTKTSIEQIGIDNTGTTKIRSSSLINNDIDSSPLLNSNILIYGDNHLSYIDRDLKWHNFIHLKCKFVKLYKDFCLLGTNTKIVVMNIKSKRIICTLELENSEYLKDGYLENESFYILYSNKIQTYSFDLNILTKIDLPNNFCGFSLSKHKNMFFIQNNLKSSLLVIDSDTDTSIFRIFDVEKYCVDSKILIGISDTKIKIFDISTGSLIEIIDTNKKLVDICVLDDFKFVALLDIDSNIHILSNQSHFNSIINSKISGVSKIKLKIPVIKKENDLYRDLFISKNFDANNPAELDNLVQALNKEEANEMLKIIHRNIKIDFFESQKLLKKLLLYKNKDLDLDIVKEMQIIVEDKLKEIENCALKTLGFLTINKIN